MPASSARPLTPPLPTTDADHVRVVRPQAGAASGWVVLQPRFQERLAGLGWTTADRLLGLPGEVVSGHPDRHVVRVDHPGWGGVLYLKRQHRVGWRQRLQQWLAGFGWGSRCEREARLLQLLESSGFPCPGWVAYGEDHRGRAFLLVEELAGVEELRTVLGSRLPPEDSARLAERLGQAVAELHAAGFDTPDLTAKHIFVDRESFAVTLIDWQSARRVRHLDLATRERTLAALQASLADHLARPRDRARFLWAYCRVGRRMGLDTPRFAALARAIDRLAEIALKRRSIRDQREPKTADATGLRLVWLAGEAVCAVPDVAAVWPSPAVTEPFYDLSPTRGEETLRVALPDGRAAALIRGRSFAPLSRFLACVRSRPWRSPGVTLGRILFHLQRYGIPAPRLFAFGQRETGRTVADWFALHEPPAGTPLAEWLSRPHPLSLRREVLEQVGLILRLFHDAGCRYFGQGPLFWVAANPTGRVSVGGVQVVRIARQVTPTARWQDIEKILRGLTVGRTDYLRVIRGYFGCRCLNDPSTRTTTRLTVARMVISGRK